MVLFFTFLVEKVVPGSSLLYIKDYQFKVVLVTWGPVNKISFRELNHKGRLFDLF